VSALTSKGQRPRTAGRAGARRWHGVNRLALAAMLLGSAAACRPKATQQECEELLDRYADLVTREKAGDASPDQLKATRSHERDEARGDDVFKNCRSEVSQTEYSCAMRAATSEQLVKCLE
jgi:hypothetical protein